MASHKERFADKMEFPPASRMPVSVSVLSLIKYILIAGLHSW